MHICMIGDSYADYINNYAICRVFMCKSENISQEAFLFLCRILEPSPIVCTKF